MIVSLLKSVLDQDDAPIVVCDTAHRIVYMNPTAARRYQRYGGVSLIGKSLLDCHNAQSKHAIEEVLNWFAADVSHNMIHTTYNAAENKDVYMIALRDDQGSLIGYYEKHAYRTPDPSPFYEGLEMRKTSDE